MRLLVVLALLPFVPLAGCQSGDPLHPPLRPFPSTFSWGTATAPYQVEGGLHNSDWYQWESTPANVRMAHADDGPNEYQYYDQDFALAEELGNNALRFGLDWSRLFPTRASFPASPDPDALAHYHALIASLEAHHLRPMVTLYHWAFPIWIDDLTLPKDTVQGWLDDNTIQLFAEFAGWAAKEFGADVDDWITLNEPTVTVLVGYGTGGYPPERSFSDPNGIATAEHVFKNLIYAHAAAYDAIHANDTVDADGDGQPAQVSCAFHQRVFEPNDPTSADDQAATAQIHYLSNQVFLNSMTRGDLDYDLDGKLDGPMDKVGDPAIAHRLDYIGVNYYGVSRVIALGKSAFGPFIGLPQQVSLDDGRPETEFGWSIDPEGFRTVLDEAASYHLPIYITENGIADSTDNQRPRFLADHLYVLQKAIQDGLDIRGYYHWSLIDNFEWAAGYCPRFGLYHVDYGSPARTRTAGEGARVYQEIIAHHGVDPSLFKRYPSYPPPVLSCSGGG